MIREIAAQTFPYDRTHDLYQEYYRKGLRLYAEENGGKYSESSSVYSTRTLHALRVVRHSYKLRRLLEHGLVRGSIDRAAVLVARGSAYAPPPPVGIYEMGLTSGTKIRICIDANDSGEIRADAAESCDLYFKSNYWPALTYPKNVVPIANLNPLVARHLPELVEMRKVPKKRDLFAFIRVWGGRDEVEGIAHNIEILKTLANLQCRKLICAYLVAGDISSTAAQLDKLGVPWTTQPMPRQQLWEEAAASRLNLIRLGMHECIPWRMTDMLAMGGCPVIDYGPQTRWPAPLVEGETLLNLHCAPGQRYDSNEMISRFEGWLSEEPMLEQMARNTAGYFDQHLRPAKLGAYIAGEIERRMGA